MIGDKESRAGQITGRAGPCRARNLDFVLSVMGSCRGVLRWRESDLYFKGSLLL